MSMLGNLAMRVGIKAFSMAGVTASGNTTAGVSVVAGNAGEKWLGGLSPAVGDITINNTNTMRNVRTLSHQSVEARALLTRWADSVADSGLRYKSMPDHVILGITKEKAIQWGMDVDRRIHLWAMNKAQHRAEIFNFYKSQHMFTYFKERDNDVFNRIFYSKDRDLLNPVQFDFTDTSAIRGSALTTSYGLNGQPHDGIKRDKRGREVSYDIWVRKVTNGRIEFDSVTVPRKGTKSKRFFMLHSFDAEYANQGRGFPKLHTMIQEFSQIMDLKSSKINQAIHQSQFWGYVQPSKDEDVGTSMPSIPGGADANAFGNSGTLANAEGGTVTTDESVKFYNMDGATYRTPGDKFVGFLQKGQDFKSFDSGNPADSFNQFIDSFMAYLSAASGMPIEALLMRFGSNYSASRAALLLFWRVVNIKRAWLTFDYLNPLKEMWLAEEIAAGRIQAPGYDIPTLKAAWNNGEWIGSPPPDIDPDRTTKAQKRRMELGLTTGQRESIATTGTNHKDNMDTLEDEFDSRPPGPWVQDSGGNAGSSDGGSSVPEGSAQASANGSIEAFAQVIDDMAGQIDDLEEKMEDISDAKS